MWMYNVGAFFGQLLLCPNFQSAPKVNVLMLAYFLGGYFCTQIFRMCPCSMGAWAEESANYLHLFGWLFCGGCFGSDNGPGPAAINSYLTFAKFSFCFWYIYGWQWWWCGKEEFVTCDGWCRMRHSSPIEHHSYVTHQHIICVFNAISVSLFLLIFSTVLLFSFWGVGCWYILVYMVSPHTTIPLI